jgi:hypothetical protein
LVSGEAVESYLDFGARPQGHLASGKVGALPVAGIGRSAALGKPMSESESLSLVSSMRIIQLALFAGVERGSQSKEVEEGEG